MNTQVSPVDSTKLRIRVAELCGWKKETGQGKWKKDAQRWISPEYRICTVWSDGGLGGDLFPDYCNDLNACHEFERAMTLEQRNEYADQLFSMLGTYPDNYAPVWHATAEQRCRAFVATMEGNPEIPSAVLDEVSKKLSHTIMASREKILKAFIAEVGCRPSECIMIQDGWKWYVRKQTAEEMERAKISQQSVSAVLDVKEEEEHCEHCGAASGYHHKKSCPGIGGIVAVAESVDAPEKREDLVRELLSACRLVLDYEAICLNGGIGRCVAIKTSALDAVSSAVSKAERLLSEHAPKSDSASGASLPTLEELQFNPERARAFVKSLGLELVEPSSSSVNAKNLGLEEA